MNIANIRTTIKKMEGTVYSVDLVLNHIALTDNDVKEALSRFPDDFHTEDLMLFHNFWLSIPLPDGQYVHTLYFTSGDWTQ